MSDCRFGVSPVNYPGEGVNICVPLIRLFFVEMTRPSIYNI